MGFSIGGFASQTIKTLGGSIQGAVGMIGGATSKTITGSLTAMNKSGASWFNPAITAGIKAATNIAGNYISDSLNKFAQKGVNSAYSTQINKTPGLSNQYARYVFEKFAVEGGMITNPIEYSGYTPDITGPVPPAYIIKVFNTKNRIVKGVMQEGFGMSTSSNWDPLIPFGIDKLVNYVSQLAGKSLMSKWMTRRMWTGTKPLSLNVVLRFNAVNDEWVEVTRACMRLQQMALPSLPFKDGSAFNVLPLVHPPGPSPFKGTGGFDDANLATGVLDNVYTGMGDQITIEIGKFLRFPSVIIKSVDVKFEPKFTKMNLPISAIVRLTFETYEMIMLEDLEKVYVTKG